jgi:polyisoprenyl-phosphate glycosyltransferase
MSCFLSIVIPVYRSALILPKLVEEIRKELFLEGISDNFEILLINDASPDNSWQIICELSERFPFVKGISLRKNFGQHNATMAGLNHASGKFVVIMDDDLQHPPHAIVEIVHTLSNGFDVCFTQYRNRQHAIWKKFGSWFNDWVASRLLNKPRGIYLSSFKGLSGEVVKEIIRYDGPYAYVDGLILDVTRSITSIDINHQARHEGEGGYNLYRSLSLWLKMSTSFSVLPLRIATVIGFILTSISLTAMVILIFQKFTHPEWPEGWASIITTILFVGGIQTFCLGMMGEYLGRTYLKLNHKPQFVIGKTTWQIETPNE